MVEADMLPSLVVINVVSFPITSPKTVRSSDSDKTEDEVVLSSAVVVVNFSDRFPK